MFFATGDGVLVIAIVFAWLLSWLVARVVTESTRSHEWGILLALAIPLTVAGAAAGPRRAYAFQTALRHLSPAGVVVAGALTAAVWFLLWRVTRSGAKAALGAVAVGLVLAASTLARDVQLRGDAATRVVNCLTDPSNLVPGGGDGLWYGVIPNVALYVPLGIAVAAVWARAPRPALRAAGVGAALSGAIELYQATLTTRVCSPGDTVTNALGAILGAAALTMVIRRLAPARAADKGTLPTTVP